MPTAARAQQRVHELLGSHLAAERHGRRRRSGPQLRARHGLRSGDDAPAARRARWIRSPGSWRRVPASCATRSPATRFRRAGSIANALKLMQLYPAPNSAGLNNNYVVEPRPTATTRTRSTSASITTSAATIASSRATASRTTTRCARRRSRATATAAGFSEGDEKVRRQRLRGQPHARAVVDADQRGAVRPGPRAHLPAAAERRRYERPARDATGSSAFRSWPATAASRSHRIGQNLSDLGHASWVVSERFSNTRAVQRQPDEGVQVARLQGRLHLPEHLLRVDAAAVRARRIQLRTAATRRS